MADALGKDALLGDPLGPVTRQERTTLLLVSVVAQFFLDKLSRDRAGKSYEAFWGPAEGN
jgi:hypothetical protein